MNQKLKTNIGLVEYCKAQVGRPYWYGTFGNEATLAMLQYKRKQYPKYYRAKDFEGQIGQKVHDCIGLIKGYMWTDNADDTKPKYQSNNFKDWNADGYYAKAKRKGIGIQTMPDEPGVAVFMPGHVGVYVGNGWVVEARGHAFGVVKTLLKDRPWTKWAYIDEIQYL